MEVRNTISAVQTRISIARRLKIENMPNKDFTFKESKTFLYYPEYQYFFFIIALVLEGKMGRGGGGGIEKNISGSFYKFKVTWSEFKAIFVSHRYSFKLIFVA